MLPMVTLSAGILFALVWMFLLPVVTIAVAFLYHFFTGDGLPLNVWTSGAYTWIAVIIAAFWGGMTFASGIEQEVEKENRTDYTTYLSSPEWQGVRRMALEYAQGRCQVCNSSGYLHVHHRTYARLGQENPSDVTVLCKPCHTIYHDGGRMPDRG